MPRPCVFCGSKTTLTNAHVLSQPIREAFDDISVTGSVVYRRSRQADGSHDEHSHFGSWMDVKARAECGSCNSGWTRQIEESVSVILPKLIRGEQIPLSPQDQQAVASWSVVTILLLQHTHNRAARLVIPASDYCDIYEAKTPSPLMKVFTGYLEPPGRGSRLEASAEYLAEDRSMADIARLMEADGLPPPIDMRAYTATLRWVTGYLTCCGSELRTSSSALVPAGPVLSSCLLTIWPPQNASAWPPRSLAAMGGLMALARSIDSTGIAVV